MVTVHDPPLVGQHRLENVGVEIFDVFEAGEEEQCLSVIVRRRGGTILVLWMTLKDLFFAVTMLVLSIQPLTSGVGAVADAGGLGVPQGRKDVATGGAASGCFSGRYGLDARGVEVSEGRDQVSLRVRRPGRFFAAGICFPAWTSRSGGIRATT
jgi:hypothetical protein